MESIVDNDAGRPVKQGNYKKKPQRTPAFLDNNKARTAPAGITETGTDGLQAFRGSFAVRWWHFVRSVESSLPVIVSH